MVGYTGQVVGNLKGGFLTLKFDYDWGSIYELLLPSVIIAIVGFAEPASIARTFAKEDGTKWNPNKELVSQGVANLAAAVSNAFPVGGSFGRSALNKFAGATSPWAGAITGAFVLASLPFTPALEKLPSAILGATVIGAVIKLVKPLEIQRLLTDNLTQGLIAVGTLVATLLTAPRIDRGIVIGLFLALLDYLWRKRSNLKPKQKV